MRFVWIPLIFVITSCATTPSYQYIQGGETVDQPGVSLVLPEGRMWVAMMRSTYVAAFGASGMPNNETLIVGTRVYNAPPSTNKQEFLEAIKKIELLGQKLDASK